MSATSREACSRIASSLRLPGEVGEAGQVAGVVEAGRFGGDPVRSFDRGQLARHDLGGEFLDRFSGGVHDPHDSCPPGAGREPQAIPDFVIWRTAGPRITTKRLGKMQKIRGKSIFTGAFWAAS